MPEDFNLDIYHSVCELIAKYPDKTEQIGYVLGHIVEQVTEIEENTLNPHINTVGEWLNDQGIKD